jgi:predicted nucleic acid-binding protein
MPVLVDTNVLSDVIHQDPVWSAWSSEQLIQHAGDLVVNPIIFAELCCRATSAAEVAQIIRTLGLDYEELSQEALFLAAKAFMTYRRQGGGKTSPLPDFFIGAHAEAAGYTLLTRDKGRYQTYFPTVPLISP